MGVVAGAGAAGGIEPETPGAAPVIASELPALKVAAEGFADGFSEVQRVR